MAELNYTDVHRAVQEGVRTLQNDVQRLTNNLGSVSHQADRIDDIELLVRDLQRMILLMQNNLNIMRQSGVGATDPKVAQIAADVHDLKLRFAVIERFASQMSAYVQAKYEEEQEDQQYRDA